MLPNGVTCFTFVFIISHSERRTKKMKMTWFIPVAKHEARKYELIMWIFYDVKWLIISVASRVLSWILQKKIHFRMPFYSPLKLYLLWTHCYFVTCPCLSASHLGCPPVSTKWFVLNRALNTINIINLIDINNFLS